MKFSWISQQFSLPSSVTTVAPFSLSWERICFVAPKNGRTRSRKIRENLISASQTTGVLLRFDEIFGFPLKFPFEIWWVYISFKQRLFWQEILKFESSNTPELLSTSIFLLVFRNCLKIIAKTWKIWNPVISRKFSLFFYYICLKYLLWSAKPTTHMF